MIVYIFKMIASSGILLLVYKLLFENEKMHRFNRFYLLFALTFSLIVPLISFEIAAPSVSIPVTQYVRLDDPVPIMVTSRIAQAEQTSMLPLIGLMVYMLIAVLLAVRFSYNFWLIYSRISEGDLIYYKGYKIVLMEKEISPHSFLNYVFISRTDFNDPDVSDKLIKHELVHLRQFHSIDIIVVELMQIIFWFNPFLPFYKSVIQLNHEFLADDSVLRTIPISDYQQLLLEKISSNSGFYLASNFNYHLTKKRFIMMKRSTSKARGIIRILLAATLFVSTAFLLSTKIVAQTSSGNLSSASKQTKQIKNGVSEELMQEYEFIVQKRWPHDNDMKSLEKGIAKKVKFTPDERKRLEYIYRRMSKEQLAKQTFGFMQPQILLPNNPTETQLTSWKDAAKFGVWIDDKKVDNKVLNNFKASDFARYDESRLLKNALNYKIHQYQVDLMTRSYYNFYREKAKTDTSNYIEFRCVNLSSRPIISLIK